jgi:lipopolysaccharide transport system permease protein/teichoic acid transport system permease protein
MAKNMIILNDIYSFEGSRFVMGYIKQFYDFLKAIFISKELIFELTKRDFQARYLGSYLGMAWAFLQPTITILIFWFVFEVGFKSMPVDNVPFVLWLVSGILPWFFISDSISNATNSIIDNAYLVKKVAFRVSILPVTKILSALYIHMFFIGVLFSMFLAYGYMPNLYNLQILYYLFAMIVLILGISWMTASLVIFLRDVGQIVAMLLQFGFWLTPIFWSVKVLPAKYLTVLKLNPFYYIVEGYRNSFIYHKWFWQDVNLTIYFWFVTILIFLLGAIIFKKTRPHFADVI